MTVIEQLSLPLISTFLHKSLDPFMIRLQATGDLGYKRDWTIVAMPPKRHIAYAIQWFAMAALVGIVWIIVTIKRISKQKEPR